MDVTRYLGTARLTVARRNQALKRMDRIVARTPDYAFLAEDVAVAIEAHDKAARLNWAYRGRSDRNRMHGKEARKLDRILARGLSSVARMLEGTRAIHEVDAPAYKAATVILDILVPNGVAAITHLPYVEGYVAIDTRLADLRTTRGRWRREVGLVGAGPMLDRLAEVNDQYGRVLGRRSSTKVAWSDVTAADDASLVLAHVVIARILGAFVDQPEHLERLMEPWWAQEAEARTWRLRRRATKRAARASKDGTSEGEPHDEAA